MSRPHGSSIWRLGGLITTTRKALNSVMALCAAKHDPLALGCLAYDAFDFDQVPRSTLWPRCSHAKLLLGRGRASLVLVQVEHAMFFRQVVKRRRQGSDEKGRSPCRSGDDWRVWREVPLSK
jgi:hypothetical protein